jgi:hypothetical protein
MKNLIALTIILEASSSLIALNLISLGEINVSVAI